MSRSPARQELARLIEHTLRRADATRADIEQLCAEARAHGFASVCVNGSRVIEAVHFLDGSGIKVTCAIGFPLGASDGDVKRYETEVAIDSGAHFIELTANLGRLRDSDDAYVLRELRDVVEAADERPVSVNLDLSLLDPEELDRAVRLAVEAAKAITLSGGADLTAIVETVRRIGQVAGDGLGVKVDQHTLSVNEVTALLDVGATRFGLTASVKLMESLP